MKNEVDIFLDIMVTASIMCSLGKLTPEVAEFGNMLLAKMLGVQPLIPVTRENGWHVAETAEPLPMEAMEWVE